jgi:hypothetical protein
VILSNEVECDEAYVIAGHKRQPAVVKHKGSKGRRRRRKGKGGRGTMEKERPPVFGMMERGGQVVIHLLANVKQKTIEPLMEDTIVQQFPLMAQSPQTSAARRAFGAVRLSISLRYRCFCRHRGSLVSWKKTWGRARGALTPRRGHLVRDWRGKGTGKLESRGIDRKDGGGTLQAVEQGFEQLTHRLQGVGVKQRAHALP